MDLDERNISKCMAINLHINHPDDIDKSDPKPRRKSMTRVTFLCLRHFFIASIDCSEQSIGVGVAAIEGCRIIWDHVIEYVYGTLVL